MKDNGSAAFPHAVSHPNGWEPAQVFNGMSLRDYFAAKAMQGMLATARFSSDTCVADAYTIADAMLKARSAG